MDEVVIYRRKDHRWAWRRMAPNGRIVATDGGQGYEHLSDAMDEVDELFSGIRVKVLSLEPHGE